MVDKNHGSSCGMSQSEEQARKDRQIKQRLETIRHKIVVLSGKGGVGKSTVAACIAAKLSAEGYKVGLLDVDLHGPSQPRIFGVKDKHPTMTEHETMKPVPVAEGLDLMSIGLLLSSDKDALIWRGPLKIGVIQQFIADVEWGELDYLIVDCPPGTGDEPLSVVQMIPDAKGLMVTTPQGMAVEDVQKSITFCRKVNLDVIGIVENMRGITCPHCNETIEVFPGNGGEAMAKETGIPLLGSIPINPTILQAGDEGNFLSAFKEMTAFDPIVAPLLTLADSRSVASDPVSKVQSNQRIQTVAVPVEPDRTLCAHFGHAPGFAMFVVDTEKGHIVEQRVVAPPEHQPGVLPRWIAAQGVHTVLVGGMGEKAKAVFQSLGVTVMDGVVDNGQPAETLVRQYLDGILAQGGPGCTHDHDEDHAHGAGSCGSGGSGCGGH